MNYIESVCQCELYINDPKIKKKCKQTRLLTTCGNLKHKKMKMLVLSTQYNSIKSLSYYTTKIQKFNHQSKCTLVRKNTHVFLYSIVYSSYIV